MLQNPEHPNLGVTALVNGTEVCKHTSWRSGSGTRLGSRAQAPYRGCGTARSRVNTLQDLLGSSYIVWEFCLLFHNISRIILILKRNYRAVTGVAQLVECCPTKRKVAGLIPGQGTCSGCRFRPWSGHVGKAATCGFSLTSVFLSLSFSLLPLSLKINK